jgi:hypothetical protein
MAEAKSSSSSVSGKPILVDRLGRPVKHGMHATPEYRAWQHMKDRCYNPKSRRYNRYGARGIRVCDQWRESFETFYADMGPRPPDDRSIERIDNDGNYEPGNCCWATRADQNRNRSDNIILEYGGLKMTATEWAKKLGLNNRTFFLRLEAGWSAKDAITRPVEQRTWNGQATRQSKVSWKRRRALGTAQTDVLIAMAGREWVFPRDIALSVGFACFDAMNSLVARGFVETKQISNSAVNRFRAYRITEAGRLEIHEAGDGEPRDEPRLKGGLD